MDWEAIGAIAEMCGAIGVIASMAYLAGQVRTSNKLARSEAKIAATSQMNSLFDNFISEPSSKDIWARGRRNITDLSREERGMFDNIALKGFMIFSAQHFQFRIGTLEQEDWAEAYQATKWWLEGQGMRDWWREFGYKIQSDSFREFVEAEIHILEGAPGADVSAQYPSN